jgi:hypothetical protein
MTLDEQLLKKAQREAARFAELERDAQLARADYHTAVRRLHLAGGSLREIAEALGVSHQRVQQIVNDAGGSWWRRVWRTRIVKRDAVCTYCGRPPGEVAKLIAGPNVYICDACVARAERTLTAGTDRGSVVLSKSLTARCSFCHRRKSAERPLIAQPSANICGECLRLCREILDGRAA